MAARSRKSRVAPELVLAQGPVAMSCLGGEIVDETMLLDGYDAHLQLLENRPKTTAGTYRTHVKAFLRYLAINCPSVSPALGAPSVEAGRADHRSLPRLRHDRSRRRPRRAALSRL